MLSYKLRYRITLQQQSNTQDAYGEPSHKWNDVATVWAEIQPLNGKEIFSAQANQHQVSSKIIIRYRNDITPAMRIKQGHTEYNIEAVLPQGRRELHLLCSTGERHA
jgi:SPP1 family predicted phage head-tail adaptor